VGFNPFREQVKHRSDIALVIAAFVVVIALVLWALFG
jgi:chorismate synthase